MFDVTRYDAKDTSIIVKDMYITGLGEDMFSAEKDEDNFTESVGAQGDVVTSESNNRLGTITLNVQPTSPQRKFLLSLANETEPFPIWAVNKKLGIRCGGTKARLLKYPATNLGAEAEDQEFTFRVFDLVME